MAAVLFPYDVPIGKSATGADDNLPLAECLNNKQLIEENQKLEKEIIQLRAKERKRRVLQKQLIGKENKIKQLRANSVLMQMSASIRHDKKNAANDKKNAANEAANDAANVMIKNLLKTKRKTIQAQQKQIDKLKQEAINHRIELQKHEREITNHKAKMERISVNIANIQQLLGNNGPRYKHPYYKQYATKTGDY
tara:strand:- start:102 stop:686 length:585 start_codon:yes stop_codon:yes gene_type:complete